MAPDVSAAPPFAVRRGLHMPHDLRTPRRTVLHRSDLQTVVSCGVLSFHSCLSRWWVWFILYLPLVITKDKVKTKLVSLQYVHEGMDLWVEDLCLCFFIKLLVIFYIVGQNHTHMALCEQIYEFFTWLVLFCTFINIHQHSSTFINRRVNDVIITNLAENVFVLIYTIFEKFIYRGNNKRVAFDRLKYSIPRTFDS